MGTLIKADGSEVEIFPRKGKAFTLEELTNLVGGPIELLILPSGEDMYLNEDGKMLGLPYNARGTLLGISAGIADSDYVVGNVVVCRKGESE